MPAIIFAMAVLLSAMNGVSRPPASEVAAARRTSARSAGRNANAMIPPSSTGRRSPLREHVGEQRDRGGVPAQVLGPDLVERVCLGVVNVEIVVAVRLQIEGLRPGVDDRLDVGAERVRAKAPDAELAEGGEQRRHR